MSKTFTSQPSRLTNATRERSVNRRVPPNQQAGTSSSSRAVGNTTSTRGRARRSNMNNQLNQQKPGEISGFNSAHTSGQQNAIGTAQPLQSPTRTATHANGYSVIPPNQRKREEISQMAERETQAYEQFKKDKAIRHVNHVGKVGGGKVTEEQVRKEQAQALRRQKLDRMKRQEEIREAKKKAEEAEIETKRAEARRKAEQNASRNATVPPPEEIRRKREAFLSRLENQSSTSAAASPSQPTPHAQPPWQTTAPVPLRQSKPAGSLYHASSGRY